MSEHDDNSPLDAEKRRFLLIAANSCLGCAAVAAAATPFVMSMMPSERARAAGGPVEVDIGKIEPGGRLEAEWQGKPVWIVHRTPEMLESLKKDEDRLRDPASANREQQPQYAANEYRSIKPEFLVLVGICTHLGCNPIFRPEAGVHELGADWPGGFFCPCHGSRFDLAGRVFKGVPAPINLKVPPYRYKSDTTIVIGENPDAKGA